MFYAGNLQQLLQSGSVTSADSVLVVCGGPLDAAELAKAGFTDVTISNVDPQAQGDYAPARWSFQNAEQLSFPDEAFDLVVVNAGLHHCYSPHRALLEMYRVARKGVLAMEARDSWLMRLAVRLGMAVEYELEAVSDHGYASGGVANSPVPNFIYRWTEREVRKVIRSAFPQYRENIRFFYGLRMPYERLAHTGRRKQLVLTSVLYPFLWIFTALFPRQGNEFGFYIAKYHTLQPWMASEERVDDQWALRNKRDHRTSS